MGGDTQFAKIPIVLARVLAVPALLLARFPIFYRKKSVQVSTWADASVFAFFFLLIFLCFDVESSGAGENMHEQCISCVSSRFLALLGVILRFVAFSRVSTRCLRFLFRFGGSTCFQLFLLQLAQGCHFCFPKSRKRVPAGRGIGRGIGAPGRAPFAGTRHARHEVSQLRCIEGTGTPRDPGDARSTRDTGQLGRTGHWAPGTMHARSEVSGS